MIDNLEQVEAAFIDELEKIALNPGRFLAGGAKGWSKLLSGKALAPAGKGVGSHMKQIYEAGKSSGGGMWGGVKALGRSQYGQMAGAAAVPLAAGYMAHKALQ